MHGKVYADLKKSGWHSTAFFLFNTLMMVINNSRIQPLDLTKFEFQNSSYGCATKIAERNDGRGHLSTEN
jgi:hypothetical protein